MVRGGVRIEKNEDAREKNYDLKKRRTVQVTKMKKSQHSREERERGNEGKRRWK